jgi:hypothetical protein
MKKHILFAREHLLKAVSCFLLLFALSFSTAVQAQNTATVEDTGKIALNKSAPLSPTYVADVAHYKSNLTGQSQGQAFMVQMFGKDHISMSLNYSTKKLTISLLPNATTNGWSLADWNNYLKAD